MDSKHDSRADNDSFRFGQYSPQAALGTLLRPVADRITSTVETLRHKAIELNQQCRCERHNRLIEDVN